MATAARCGELDGPRRVAVVRDDDERRKLSGAELETAWARFVENR